MKRCLLLRDVEEILLIKRNSFCDIIYINLKDETAFDKTGDKTSIKIDVRKGNGERWLKNYFGLTPDKIVED